MSDTMKQIGEAFNSQVQGFKRGSDGMLDLDFGPQPEPAQAPTPPPTSQDDPYEQRFKDVQGWATKVAQENADLRNQMAGMQSSLETLTALVRGDAPSGDRQDEIDLSDPESLQAFINQRIQAGVEEQLKPYGPAINQVKSNLALQSFIYGDGTPDNPGIGEEAWNLWGPAMLKESERLINADLDVPEFPKLLRMVQDIYEPVPQGEDTQAPADGDTGPQQTTPQQEPAQPAPDVTVTPAAPAPQAPTAEELQARAQRTHVVQGVAPTQDDGSGVPTQEPVVESIGDAMRAAYAEMGGKLDS